VPSIVSMTEEIRSLVGLVSLAFHCFGGGGPRGKEVFRMQSEFPWVKPTASSMQYTVEVKKRAKSGYGDDTILVDHRLPPSCTVRVALYLMLLRAFRSKSSGELMFPFDVKYVESACEEAYSSFFGVKVGLLEVRHMQANIANGMDHPFKVDWNSPSKVSGPSNTCVQ